MNSSQFMDKQIMDLSRSKKDEFFEFMNPQEEQQEVDGGGGGGGKNDLKEEIVPSYDFQPIRPVGSSQSLNHEGNNIGGTRVGNSSSTKTNTSVRNYGSLEPNESTKLNQEKDANAYNAVMLSEIDCTMKKHADDLLHALEGVSARLSQMESRTRNLESSVDNLKLCVQDNHGSTEGKLTQLENMIRELQTGAQFLRQNQEIAASQLHQAKLQSSNVDHQFERQNSTTHSDFVHQSAFAPQSLPPQLLPVPSPPDGPPPQPQQNQPPPQISTQVPQNQMPSIPQREPYFRPPGPLPETTHQQYQLPPSQELQPPHPSPPQHYQSPPQQLPPHYQSSQFPPQHQAPITHRHEETPYMPPQTYPPSIHHSSSMTQPPSTGHSSQQLYGAPPHMYDPSISKPAQGISQGYGLSSNLNDSYSYSGSPNYRSSTMKQPQISSSPSAPSGGGGNYPRLPTAQILPHALPTASSVGGGSSSGGTGNKVPIDDVVDKVATMGFSRDQVRATVRKLTENGQTVDLNVVLDKLMNGGDAVQPQTGWYGR